MAEQEPHSKDPWNRQPNQGPPDLLTVIKRFFSKSRSSQDGGGSNTSSFRFIGLIAVGIVALWALTGLFIVSPPEQSVILRFGRYVGTVGPGLHWVPRLIESHVTINVQQVRNFSYSAEMLTKDENIVQVSLAVQYRIDKPNDFLFNVVDPSQTIRQATSSALRQIVGTMTLDSVLTTGRQDLRDRVTKVLNQTLNSYKTGLAITDVNLQPAKPPEPVTAAFDDAIKAREDEQRYINRARAYAKRVTSIAQGQVARLKESAQAYRQQVSLRAKGDTARYLALLTPYQRSPKVTGERMYIDTLSDVLSQTTNVIVDSSGSNVLYLPLDQILRKQQLSSRQTQNSSGMTKLDSNSSSTLSSSSNIYDALRPSYTNQREQNR